MFRVSFSQFRLICNFSNAHRVPIPYEKPSRCVGQHEFVTVLKRGTKYMPRCKYYLQHFIFSICQIFNEIQAKIRRECEKCKNRRNK
jgi:hypothetical protein